MVYLEINKNFNNVYYDHYHNEKVDDATEFDFLFFKQNISKILKTSMSCARSVILSKNREISFEISNQEKIFFKKNENFLYLPKRLAKSNSLEVGPVPDWSTLLSKLNSQLEH